MGNDIDVADLLAGVKRESGHCCKVTRAIAELLERNRINDEDKRILLLAISDPSYSQAALASVFARLGTTIGKSSFGVHRYHAQEQK
jgi:hypothetical protein